jgi:hypothetical protein
MNVKKCFSFVLVFLLVGLSINEADAQRRGTKKRTSKTEKAEDSRSSSRSKDVGLDWKQNLVYEIGFGNPTFFGGGGQSQFNIALKPGVGYKIVDRVAAGVFIKGDYTFANLGGNEFSLLDYGAGLFAKFRVIDAIYIRAEGTYQNYSFDRRLNILNRGDFIEPLIGAGYRSSNGGPWAFGGELLFHMNREVRDFAGQVFEFWIKLDYNF